MSMFEGRYKRNFDNNIEREPAFNVKDYLFVYRAQPSAVSSDAAD